MIPIPKFEHYYIEETGNIINTASGRSIKPSLNENGYWYVSLWKNNKGKTFSLHRLVAQAFIPNPENKPFVNHLDADRTNTHKDNLEWCTQSENIKHAYQLGTMSQKKNFDLEELDWLLNEVISGQTMTGLAEHLKVGLSRLTINLRNHAHQINRMTEFENELRRQKAVRNTQANASKQKPVAQLDQFGNVLYQYPSATAAARALGKSTSGPIFNALNPNNSQRIGYGFQWKYI